jgi:hypothetical protein
MRCQIDRCEKCVSRLGCWARWTVWVVLFVCFSTAANADNIFDDNWTPPKRTEKGPETTVVPTRPNSTPVTPAPPVVPPVDKAPAATKPPLIQPPAAELAPLRRAVPAKADQDRSRKLMKEVFAQQLSDRSTAARRKLAQELLSEAGKITDNPVDQFVLLSAAVQAAREAGSAPLCFEAADGMAKSFDVDGLAVRTEAALKMPFAADPPDVAAENVRAGMELLDELLEVGDFVSATRLGSLLQKASASNASQRTVVQQRVKEIADLRLAHDRFFMQRDKLKSAPDDPAANLAVGNYYAFVKRQWDLALPFLAKGSNAAVKAAVTLEQSRPKSADQLIATGDAWWDAGEKEAATAPGRAAMHGRAAYFYGQALDGGGVTGLSRTRLEKRVEVARKSDPSPSGGITRPQNVLLWRGGGPAEREMYKAIAEGRVREVSKADTAAVLADSATYANYTIVVFSTNRWRETPAEDITETAQHALQEFVRNGGDLIFFEQFAMTNMSIVDGLFGIKTNGGPQGAFVEDAELRSKLQDAGYTDLMLQSVHFYNTYNQLPERTRILLRAGGNHAPAAVVVPFGKGRLILVGTNWDKLEEKLNEALLQVIYHPKAAKPQ